MRGNKMWRGVLAVVTLASLAAVFTGGVSSASTSSQALGVTWMRGFAAPGTPAKYNKVGIIKVGPRSAKNVLVLEPGTSAGAAYFVPLAKWIISKTTGWQIWSVERRENLFEDQSELNLYKKGHATSTQLFDYYLGYLKDPSITHHYQLPSAQSVVFAKQWGMNVAVQDLHSVITAAKKLDGKVVLGGHSLGGSVVTAYATWNFKGRAGADDLAGLIYIDGGSGATPESTTTASAALQSLAAPSASPWLTFGGIPAPYAGIFSSTGSLAALLDPNSPSLGESSGILPADIVPSVPVTNVGLYGFALNAATSPAGLLAAQGHLGTGIAAGASPHGWNGAGALTPIKRFATMFSGYPLQNVDGTEWFFPQRLTDDTGAVDNGNANAAQTVLDVHATMGHKLPKALRIYAFGARLGGAGVLQDARILAAQSHIALSHLTLVNRQSTYSHNDPAGAYPTNVFFQHLVPFLGKISG
jgi:pimeloyl-ACP methyl ester carboxylesterase